MRVRDGLLQDQEERFKLDPENAVKVQEFLEKLDKYIKLELPWTLKLNDPSGNCYIQNPSPMHVDPRCITSHYYRGL
jgi:zinc finger protein